MSENVIEAKQLTKTYGKGESAFTALYEVSLAIKQGESVAILGKSGSGKSTLMHHLALLDSPTSGSVLIDGEDASKLSTRKTDLIRNGKFGFVFQQFFMNSKASVLDNVTLPLKIAGVPLKERRKRGMDALKSVEMEEKAKNKANDLSGGQKQRLVIARALINNPQVIFADEPTGNLDTATGSNIQQLLFDLNRAKGMTLVVVTHDEDLAKLCNRRIEIRDGKIIKEEK